MSADLFSGLPNPLFAKTYAVIDFETTGLYPAVGDEICEVGLVRVEGGETTLEYSQLINPGRPMDPAAAQVSGISKEMLAGQPKFEEVAEDYLDLFEDSVIVAHNVEFDMAFLQYKLVRMGRQQLSNPVLDTLELARARDDTGPYTLGILANRMGIEGPHAHRALGDARMAARILIQFLTEYHQRGQDELSRLPGYRNSCQFSIDGPERGEDNSFQIVVEHIRHAIENKKDLEIAYLGGKTQTRRRVTPWQIKGMNMRGYCHLRKEERDFRLDRILECAEVDAEVPK
jgi:DNA polymerase III epsilon subunit family exonuclease